jgi:uncharacterized membrane protein
MGCCIALALLISLARTGWFRLVRRTSPPRAGFAPPARRSVPVVAGTGRGIAHPTTSAAALSGSASSTPTSGTPSSGTPSSGTPSSGGRASGTSSTRAVLSSARRPVGASTDGRRGLVGSVAVVALSAVIGVGLYSELLALLVHGDAVTVTGDRAGWRIRALTLIGAGLVAALVAVATGLHRVPAADRRRRTALALSGAGTAWSLTSIIDMHLTGLVPENLVDPLTDLTLHGPGFLAATTGIGALLAGDRWLNSLSPATTRGRS